MLRGDDFNKINNLSAAYEKLKAKTRDLYKASRFKNETVDNLFQHYGIKSKTLDLVDNIYIAIWFGTNKWTQIKGFENLCTYEQSNEDFGWIYFIQVEPQTKSQEISSPAFNGYCDLRKYHSSLKKGLKSNDLKPFLFWCPRTRFELSCGKAADCSSSINSFSVYISNNYTPEFSLTIEQIMRSMAT